MITTDFKQIFSISKKELNTIDENIFDLLKFWKSEKDIININTSGSTGNPKTITLTRKALINSAETTLKYFKLQNNSSFHCCLPTKYIGGKMMLIRALINKGKIILVKPSANPCLNLKEDIDFSAMTTMQAVNSMNNKGFNKINQLIIGGGKISDNQVIEINKKTTHCFHTFGMTETASHIAVRDLRKFRINDSYQCLDHVDISTNTNGQLVIKSKQLNIKSITTNDVVYLTGNKQFKFIGRTDNIINTGGVKIHPEVLEKQLREMILEEDFFIDKINDELLGEKIVLIAIKAINIKTIQKAINSISGYKPKIIIQSEQFYFTGNNKIDRKKTLFESLKTGKIISLK